MILYTDNQADDATVSEAGETINYPAANVQDSRLSRIYKGGETCEFNLDAGGALKSISDAYTNLIQDPTDLTTANWTMNNGLVASITTDSINGNLFTKLTADGTSDPQAVITSAVTVTASVKHTGYVIIRNGTTTGNSQFYILLTAETNNCVVNWTTKVVTLNVGDKVKYNFIDDETVEIWLTTAGGSVGTAATFRIDPDTNALATQYIYATECQLVNNTEVYYPFYAGAKSADVISESFTMPDSFTFDCIVTPYFNFDDGTGGFRVFNIKTGTPNFYVYYEQSNDTFNIVWFDGGTLRAIGSQRFDDGTTYTNLNQRIRLIGSVNLVSGVAADSRFIVIPLESGALYENATFNGTPDIKTSVLSTLYIGVATTTLQADCEFEYLRFYEGVLVGTVTDSDDVTALLNDKRLLLDKTYQYKITADALLLANTTINDGDTVTLRGNNVDSFNAGTPLDQSVTWTKDIIRQTFTKCSYQYWDLIVNSSNDIEIGRLFLGESYTTPDISPTVTNDKVSAGVKSVSVSGQSYMDKRYFYEIINTTFPKVSHAEKAELFAMFEQIDSGVPFFVTFDETEIDLGTMYVTFDSSEIRATLLANPNYYTVGITFREEI